MRQVLLAMALGSALLSQDAWAKREVVLDLDLRPVLEEPNQLYLLDAKGKEWKTQDRHNPVTMSLSVFKKETVVLPNIAPVDYLMRLAQYDCKTPGKSLTLSYIGFKLNQPEAVFDYSTHNFPTQQYLLASPDSPAFRFWQGACTAKFEITPPIPKADQQDFDRLTENYRAGKLWAAEKTEIESFKQLNPTPHKQKTSTPKKQDDQSKIPNSASKTTPNRKAESVEALKKEMDKSQN